MNRNKAFLTCWRLSILLLATACAWPQSAPASKLVKVIAKPGAQLIDLPGEFLPFRQVEIHAKVRGYIERILVDRGSVVHRGQLLAQLSAPEMTAQIAEAEAKLQAAEADRAQSEAQLAAAQSTFDRMKTAAETPGAIAGNELTQAQEQVKAAEALIQSRQRASTAAQAAVRSQKDLESYLHITAPFDGVVTDRLLHPGALVGPGPDPVLLIIQEVSHLRLVVAVPEEDVGGIVPGATVNFRVPAYATRTFSGKVARLAHSLDMKNRTMAVELDVFNHDGALSPGMYPSIHWPVRTSQTSLFVPKTSVVTTTERTFVIRDHNGHAEWVNIRKGFADGDLTQITGPLQPGDLILRRATDEVREGSALQD